LEGSAAAREIGGQEADPLGSAPESRLAALAPIRRAAAPRGQLPTLRSRARLGERKRYGGALWGVPRRGAGGEPLSDAGVRIAPKGKGEKGNGAEGGRAQRVIHVPGHRNRHLRQPKYGRRAPPPSMQSGRITLYVHTTIFLVLPQGVGLCFGIKGCGGVPANLKPAHSPAPSLPLPAVGLYHAPQVHRQTASPATISAKTLPLSFVADARPIPRAQSLHQVFTPNPAAPARTPSRARTLPNAGPIAAIQPPLTKARNRKRTLEPVPGGEAQAGSRLRSRHLSSQRKPPTGSWVRFRRVRTNAQFLLPFFCASKKGSRRKGETPCKEDNQKSRRGCAANSPRTIPPSGVHTQPGRASADTLPRPYPPQRRTDRGNPTPTNGGQQSEANPRARPRRRSAGRIASAQQTSIQPAKAAYGLLGPLPRVRTNAQFLLPFFCASKKGSRRKGEIQKKGGQPKVPTRMRGQFSAHNTPAAGDPSPPHRGCAANSPRTTSPPQAIHQPCCGCTARPNRAARTFLPVAAKQGATLPSDGFEPAP
jgi:hypothetical protein